MQSIDPAMSQEAVEILKQGHSAAVVFDRLVERGATREEAQAFVQQLLDLKQRAEEAEPARMRADATNMLQQGATPAQVVQYFASRGIPAAEADVARLAETLRRLVPCQRCRQAMDPSNTYFDRLGNQVCSNCHERDEIAAGDQRVEDRRLQEAGVSAYALQQNKALKFCPRCQDYTGVLLSATHYVGGSSHSVRHFGCTRCGDSVS